MGRFGGGRLWVGRSLEWRFEVEGCGVEVFRVEVWRLKVVGWRSLGWRFEVEGYGLEVFGVEVWRLRVVGWRSLGWRL